MIQIRDAALADASAVARIHFDTWESAYRGILADSVIDARPLSAFNKHWHEQLPLEGTTFCLVATDGAGVIGFIRAGAARDDEHRGAGEVYSFYVRKARANAGVGTLLLRAATERLGEAGFDELYLWVLDGNDAAQGFYESRGWYRDGAVKVDTSYGSPITDVLYRPHPEHQYARG